MEIVLRKPRRLFGKTQGKEATTQGVQTKLRRFNQYLTRYHPVGDLGSSTTVHAKLWLDKVGRFRHISPHLLHRLRCLLPEVALLKAPTVATVSERRAVLKDSLSKKLINHASIIKFTSNNEQAFPQFF